MFVELTDRIGGNSVLIICDKVVSVRRVEDWIGIYLAEWWTEISSESRQFEVVEDVDVVKEKIERALAGD